LLFDDVCCPFASCANRIFPEDVFQNIGLPSGNHRQTLTAPENSWIIWRHFWKYLHFASKVGGFIKKVVSVGNLETVKSLWKAFWIFERFLRVLGIIRLFSRVTKLKRLPGLYHELWYLGVMDCSFERLRILVIHELFCLKALFSPDSIVVMARFN